VRGHGRSGKPGTAEGHVSSLYADDFAAVIRAFGLTKPVFVGWSLGAAIITDICAHLQPPPISGAIAISGPPSKEPKLAAVAFTSRCLSYVPGLMSTTDATLGLNARRGFVDACFRSPESVPFAVRAAWFGYTMLQTPSQLEIGTIRQQDSSKLLHMRKGDLRLLVLYGNEDKLVDGAAAVEELKAEKYFGDVDIEVKVIEGGSHSLFIDNEEEMVDALVEFVESVQVSLAVCLSVSVVSYVGLKAVENLSFVDGNPPKCNTVNCKLESILV